MLDNTPNQPPKFKTKNWVEINDDSRGTYNTNSQIIFKTLMLKSSLYNCIHTYAYKCIQMHTYILAAPANRGEKVIFKNCTLLLIVQLKTEKQIMLNILK